MKAEVLLRMAIIRKDTNCLDASIQYCDQVIGDNYSNSVRSNALCLKGLIHELRSEFPAAEVVYRAALEIVNDHPWALERLGRVYLRYRETLSAAVQCLFKVKL